MTLRPVRRIRQSAVLALVIGLAAGLMAAQNPTAAASGKGRAPTGPTATATIKAPADAALPSATTGPEASKLVPLLATPIVSLTRTGQFQVITVDADAARAGLAMATEVWQTLATPLSLPAGGFASPVEVWLILPEKWSGPDVFRATPGLGGRISLAVCWTPELGGSETLRRALVQALLMQRAIAFHGPVPGLKVPAWLEDACVAWSLTRGRPAALDAWQAEAAGQTAPPLVALLGRVRGLPPDRAQQLALLWLLGHLQAESGDAARRWPQLLRAVLGGEDTAIALAQLYGDFFQDDAARELWWQVGFYAQSRQAAQAIETATESRVWLAERSRWLARRGEDEVTLDLEELFSARTEAWVAAELRQRLVQLRAGLATGRLHPFYRNAIMSLGRTYEAALAGNAKVFAAAEADLIRDIADGRDLEQAAKVALDALTATQRDTTNGGSAAK